MDVSVFAFKLFIMATEKKEYPHPTVSGRLPANLSHTPTTVARGEWAISGYYNTGKRGEGEAEQTA